MIFPSKPKPQPGDTRTYVAFAWFPRTVDVPGKGPSRVWLEWISITEVLARYPDGLAGIDTRDEWVETKAVLDRVPR